MSLENLQSMSAVIDHKALLTRCLNKIDFAERMLNLFHDRCGVELNDLQQAFDKGDMDAVRRISHRLSGACANAAAFGLQASASHLRHAVCEGSADDANKCLNELHEEWEKFKMAMSAQSKSAVPQNS